MNLYRNLNDFPPNLVLFHILPSLAFHSALAILAILARDIPVLVRNPYRLAPL
jgi:hypothetical protein